MRTTLILTLLAVSFLAAPTQAAIPQTIDYQAYVTDTVGSPIDDPAVSVTAVLYTMPSGGTPIWAETHVLPVDQGLVSLSLGSITSFPSGTFDTPLYLGISVGADPEMTPRRTLSSVAFAFKADDALTLSGQTAASLDQSLHVADTSNPHSVTASQTGAASAADLSTHAGDSAAHHTRYSNSEAVGAVLAADGPGSGFNADLLDGLDSSAFLQSGADFGRFGVAASLFEGTQSLSALYVNENQFGSITSAMIADGSISGADINFSINATDADVNGGLLSLTNSSPGTSGNAPAALLGQSSGDPGAFRTFGVMGLAPPLGASGVFNLPAGKKYGVAGVVDLGIGTAGLADGAGGIGVYGDGVSIGVQGVGINGPTKGYLGVQGTFDFDGETPLDINGLEIGVLGYSSGGSTTDNYGLYGASNGTGIYAEGSLLAGDFVGDVDVAGDVSVDRVAYNTPRTHYYSVADGDFHSWNGGSYGTSIGNAGAYYTASSVGALVAGLHLPDGAVITQFQAIVDDNVAGNVSVTLSRLTHAGNGFTTVASVNSSGAPGIATYTDTSISVGTVNNLTYSYHVRVYSTGWPGTSTLKIKAAIVHYTISEAG